MTLFTIIIGLAALIYAFWTDLLGDGLHTPTRAAVALGIGIACVLGGIGVAHAADFEASIGKSANTVNMAYSIGATGLVSPSLRWRAGFAALGTPAYNHWVSPEDAADDIQAGAGPGPYYWANSSNNKGLYATLAPEIHRGRWTFSVEGGLFAYRPSFQQDVSVGASADHPPARINFGPVLGASVGYGKTSVVLQFHNVTEYWDWESGTPSSKIFTLSLRRIF